MPVGDEERRELGALAWQRLKDAGHTDTKTIRSLVDPEIEAMLERAGPDGAWRRLALLPGRYVLVAPGGDREVVVGAGAVTEVDLGR